MQKYEKQWYNRFNSGWVQPNWPTRNRLGPRILITRESAMPRLIKGPSRRLGQLRPADTIAGTLWTSPFFSQFEVTLVNCVNVSTGDSKISIFHDPDGSTYDEDTALVYEYTIGPGDLFQFEAQKSIVGYKAGETIGVQSSVANAVNFKAYGRVNDEEVVP